MLLSSWIGSIIALLFVLYLIFFLKRKDSGTDEMVEISKAIQDGAKAYLKRQYFIVGLVFIGIFIILSILSYVFKLLSIFVPFAFITGGFFSGLAGFIGMTVATRSNTKTTEAAKKSLNSALRIAFSAGSVMGLTVVGLGLLDLSIWFTILKYGFHINDVDIPPIMITFGMGASTMALFARVGGGIFTKAADVGADLVGKVESEIPEDDPRNPAVIADNVGDNVGDVAGMGADLYESYVGSIVATMALGSVASLAANKNGINLDKIKLIQLPLFIASLGIIFSIIGSFFVRAKENASTKTLLYAIRRGIYFATICIAIFSGVLIYFYFGKIYINLWFSMLVGLFSGIVIGFFTEYYTSDTYKPTQKLAQSSETGTATIMISGLGLGMRSTMIPVITISLAIVIAYISAGGLKTMDLGLYGIGLAAVGMLSTLGITLATDAYGPVADNAGGIAQMAKLAPRVRMRTDNLDSLGNTTAATGKGFAIGSAALTALALIAEFRNKLFEGIEIILKNPLNIKLEAYLLNLKDSISISGLVNPYTIAGLMIGAVLPFFFSSLLMEAVGKAAGKMVIEVRRQFKEIPGIMDHTAKPEYSKCVLISTKSAQHEMIMPAMIAILAPILTGIIFGPISVIALLAGATASGFVLAIMMANSGGAWDNAKKFIEKGKHGGKNSIQHKAAVVGDTVGDPLKDTAGPSINILIKLMSMVAIVFSSLLILINALLNS
ncbi:MAG TPA: sodium-translocating pyrophosphatase [Exilispira sp.]|nr:sodium-translocating pyrophosphatase [Exilispira sp.]